MELKSQTATHWVRRFFGIGDAPKLAASEVRLLFWGLVRGLVDFVYRRQGQHTEDARKVPLPWWADLIAGAGVLRAVIASVEPRQVVRTVRWLERQVAVSLAYVVREVGADHAAALFEWLLTEGDRRLQAQYRRHYGHLHARL